MLQDSGRSKADKNMYQGWKAELYRSTSKDEQNRVNEGIEKSKIRQWKEGNKKKERIQIPLKIISSLQQKKK